MAGIFTDLLASNNSIDVSLPREGVDRVHFRELLGWKDKIDPDLKTDFAERDEVQSIAVYDGTVSGGTFTLTIDLKNEASFETAAIAFDANAATIESAIDTAATSAGVTGWTNGDISVSGGPLTTTAVTLTYDGASVSGANHDEVVIDGTALTGGGTAGDESTTTEGQGDRKALAALEFMGVFSGTVPAQGEDPSGWTAGNVNLPHFPTRSLIQELAREAALVDGNDAVFDTIIGLYNYA